MARRNRRLATRLALALAGAGFAVAGTVLVLRAVWGGVALALGPIWASALLGGGLLLTGALGLALSGRGPRPRETPDDALIVRLTTAFLEGLAAGRSRHGR